MRVANHCCTFNTVPAEILEPEDKPLSCKSCASVIPWLTAMRYKLSPRLTVYVPVATLLELALRLLELDLMLLEVE